MKLNFRENGSIGIETGGSYVIRRPDGSEELIEKARLSLCRCGASKNKPFCDTTHREIGFQAGPLEIEVR